MSEVKLTAKNIGILTTNGWTLWSRKCKSVLQSYGLWMYIEGADDMKPKDTMKFDDWHCTNNWIIGALCQVVDNSLAQEIENLTSTHDAWEEDLPKWCHLQIQCPPECHEDSLHNARHH